jgi:hypothetical protein
MILGEGAVFFSILAFAIHQIRKSIRKDIELSRQQKNFLLAVTHELKTPIASTKLYLQTMKRHQLDEAKHNWLKTLSDKMNDCNRLSTTFYPFHNSKTRLFSFTPKKLISPTQFNSPLKLINLKIVQHSRWNVPITSTLG